jgi:glucose dehydrogenase
LDANTGVVRWRFYVVPDRSRKGGGSLWTSAAIDEMSNTVYFVTGSVQGYMPPDPVLFTESILAFDCDTGEMIWYDQARPADPFNLDYNCHPMIFDAVHPSRENEVRKCVAAGNKDGVHCFNRHTGERYWRAMLTPARVSGGPHLNSTAVAYNRVFLVANATGVPGRKAMSVAAAVHAYTGDIMWWVANPATITGPVAVANQVFYQALEDGTLEAIDVKSGEQLWKYQFPTTIRSGMAIANGTLYTATGHPSPGYFWTLDDIGKKSYGIYAFSPNGR